MCTVIYYRYSCRHWVTRRKSRCGGNRTKTTRSSRRAACSAEGYITIQQLSQCSKCLKEAWIEQWQKKLERASAFHQGLLRKKLPGAEEVSDLIKELEKTYELETWEIKSTIPYGDKPKVRRVEPAKVGKAKLPTSPLKREVKPEEIVLPTIVEPVYDEDDDDWVRSTDPLHPITTNYDVFCAGVDDEYLSELTSEGEPEDLADFDQEEFNYISTSWDWGGDSTGFANDAEPEVQNFYNHILEPAVDAQELTVWGPEAGDATSASEIGMDGLKTNEDDRAEQIEAVTKEFWETVNIRDEHEPLNQPVTTGSMMGDPDVDDGGLIEPYEETESTVNEGEVQYGWTDGNEDLELSHPFVTVCRSEDLSSQTQNRASSSVQRRAANSTNAKYDAFRKVIGHLKREDPGRFYKQWLVECRLEIREIVGPQGPMIYDPPRLIASLVSGKKP